jgi:DNA-directed RNA polymerase subunit RPC12/RpoP
MTTNHFNAGDLKRNVHLVKVAFGSFVQFLETFFGWVGLTCIIRRNGVSILKVKYVCPVCLNEVNQEWDPMPLDQELCRVRCPKCWSRILLADTLCSACTKHYRMSCMDLPRIKTMQVWFV